jgi:hypothetical protein
MRVNTGLIATGAGLAIRVRETNISGAEHRQGFSASRENEPSRGDLLRWQTEQRGPIGPPPRQPCGR